ncbi:Zn(II)2Cys6 transcription factor domain-containing protein [Aspergillus lucknowensis]|uniref:Zn(2)-C6 fungal-type domain-containing protein n=1 Tax=Aspergillus lucknowensis TaxID=176173 RepID=A0ABR4LSV5_9EURO
MDMPKLSKTCDQCKSRKVRCVSQYPYSPYPTNPSRSRPSETPNSLALVCNYCEKRGLPCHFGVKKSRVKQRVRREGQLDSPLDEYQQARMAAPRAGSLASSLEQLPHYPTDGETTTSTVRSIQSNPQQRKLDFQPEKLYIDYILDDRGAASRCRGGRSLVKAHDHYVGSSGIAFFSDRRIASISERLHHRKLTDIIERLANGMRDRTSRTIRVLNAAPASMELATQSRGLYIAGQSPPSKQLNPH